jgi:phosphomannomutase
VSDQLIISSSGIRGVVGAGLTPEVVARYGAAFGTYLKTHGPEDRGYVIVGRDSRTSGEMLADAVMAGLRAVGWDARDLGIVPTPTALLATGDDANAVGALLITASHNPVEWNGLKLGSPDGRFVSPAAGLEVQRAFERGPVYGDWSRLGARQAASGAIERHIDRILSLGALEPERIARRRLRVAIDCVHGAGGLIIPPLLERLGCEIIGLGLNADGRFPRNPEPTADNLGELGRVVRESGAHLGMAVDPDVDRLSLVDGSGRPIGEDWTLALATELVAHRTPGPVVTNLSSSQCIRDAAQRAGVPFSQAPVGEANVVAAMLEAGAVIGGEGNGGVILPELHLTRDAPLAVALVLQLLTDRETDLQTLIESWPGYHIAKRKAARPAGSLEGILDAVSLSAPAGATEDRTDGLRLEWADHRWLHIRPSGTEPILRVISEAESEAEAARLVDGVVASLADEVGSGA